MYVCLIFTDVFDNLSKYCVCVIFSNDAQIFWADRSNSRNCIVQTIDLLNLFICLELKENRSISLKAIFFFFLKTIDIIIIDLVAFFGLELFKCSDTFCLVLDKAAYFFSFSLFLFTSTDEQIYRRNLYKNIPNKRTPEQKKKKKQVEKWKYLSLGYAANMNGHIFFTSPVFSFQCLHVATIFFLVLYICFFLVWFGWCRLNADDCYINTFSPIQWRDNFIQRMCVTLKTGCDFEEVECCLNFSCDVVWILPWLEFYFLLGFGQEMM